MKHFLITLKEYRFKNTFLYLYYHEKTGFYFCSNNPRIDACELIHKKPLYI